MEKKTYLIGLFAKKPHPNAPDFVKAKLSIKREELIKELQEQEGEWINIDVKEGKDGKYYTQIDTWKPSSQTVSSNIEDDEF